MSQVAEERLLLGRGYKHTASSGTSFATTAQSFAATNGTHYNASGGTTAATYTIGTCAFVEVRNDDPTNYITVELGDSESAPNTATQSSPAVYPRTTRIFQLACLPGQNAIISVKADTGACVGSIIWYPRKPI